MLEDKYCGDCGNTRANLRDATSCSCLAYVVRQLYERVEALENRLNKLSTCPTCSGSGSIYFKNREGLNCGEPCPHCKATGISPIPIAEDDIKTAPEIVDELKIEIRESTKDELCEHDIPHSWGCSKCLGCHCPCHEPKAFHKKQNANYFGYCMNCSETHIKSELRIPEPRTQLTTDLPIDQVECPRCKTMQLANGVHICSLSE